MGEIVEFPSNGKRASGYLAGAGNSGPGVVVIQEWWGLVDHIKDVCDRLASNGFVALAPDLYHGRTASALDEAQKLMMNMQMERAALDMAGAVDTLAAAAGAPVERVGAIGFCMGGALAITLATIKPLAGTVAYYGLPMQGEPDVASIRGELLGHFAELDERFTPAAAEAFFARGRELGISTELHLYPGAHHAFFNDTRPEVYDAGAADASWERTLSFLRRTCA